MADDKDYAVLQAMIEPLTQGVNAIATRPQKTYQSVTSTPYALADLEEARNQIGLSTKELNDVLKGREQLGYSLANTLAKMPQQQGYGSWLSDFARGFGMGASAPANARMARQQQIYDAQMKDLANRLAFDKAMGETQESILKYEPVEYTTTGKQSSGSGTTPTSTTKLEKFGRSVGYDPVENIPDYGPLTRAALSEEELGVMKYVPFAQTIAKGLTDKTAQQLQSTWTDISDNFLSGKVLDFVGQAGGIRVEDTPAEQEFIFGPIRNYKNMTQGQLQSGLKQARNNFVAAGMSKAALVNAERAKKGLEPIQVSEKELKDWWNSAFSVPAGMQTKNMYNVQDKPAEAKKEQATISVGQVRNGYRFKGGDPKKKENWEVAE